MTTIAGSQPKPSAGIAAFVLGSLALLMVLAHFWVGPLAPQQRVGVTVGEIAADMRQAALRKLKGERPAQTVAETRPWTTDRILDLIKALVAGLALIAGCAGLIRRESHGPAIAGIALGASAIVFQLFTWAILIVAGALIIVAIIYNVDKILDQ
jgi:hypothetical protein